MLKIVPNGVIKSGFIEIVYVPELQTLRVLGMAKIGISIFVKTFSFDETQSIPKELMKSSSFVVGAKRKIDDIELEIIGVNDGRAVITFAHDHGDCGVAEVSITGEYIDLLKIAANSSYLGKKVHFEAIKV